MDNSATGFFRQAASEASEPVRPDFEHEEEDTGGSKRPTRVTLHALHPETGERIGYLRYYVPRRKADKILVDRLETHSDHRRKGIGSALMDEMQARHPGTPIDHGDRTDDGKAWWDNYTKGKTVRRGRTIASASAFFRQAATRTASAQTWYTVRHYDAENLSRKKMGRDGIRFYADHAEAQAHADQITTREGLPPVKVVPTTNPDQSGYVHSHPHANGGAILGLGSGALEEGVLIHELTHHLTHHQGVDMDDHHAPAFAEHLGRMLDTYHSNPAAGQHFRDALQHVDRQMTTNPGGTSLTFNTPYPARPAPPAADNRTRSTIPLRPTPRPAATDDRPRGVIPLRPQASAPAPGPADYARRDGENGYDHERRVRYGLSMGHLTYAQAHELGYRGDSREDTRDDWTGEHTEGKGWQPLPPVLYHTTTDAAGVMAKGLKSGEELGQDRGHGLGGTPEWLSMTHSAEHAHNMLHALHEYHDHLNGKTTFADLHRAAQNAEGAEHPFHEEFASAITGGHNDYAKDSIRRGKRLEPGFATYDEAKEKGWTPHPAIHNAMESKDGAKVGIGWERDPTLYERHEEYGAFSRARDWKGKGRPSILFVSNDREAFAKKDPSNFAVIKARPKPGAQGFPLKGEHEWRTGTGDAVEVDGEPLRRTSARIGQAAMPPFLANDQQVHRGMAVVLPPHIHAFVHDPAQPAPARAHMLLSEVRKQHAKNNGPEGEDGSTGGLGNYWSPNPDKGSEYAFQTGREAYQGHEKEHNCGNQWDGYDGCPTTHVVIHAQTPAEKHHWTENFRPGERYDPQISWRLPVRPGAPVNVTGISWREGNDHRPYDDRPTFRQDQARPYDHYDFTAPVKKRAAAHDGGEVLESPIIGLFGGSPNFHQHEYNEHPDNPAYWKGFQVTHSAVIPPNHELHTTEEGYDPDYVDEITERGYDNDSASSDRPMIARINGKDWVADGHHRLLADRLAGRPTRVHYVEREGRGKTARTAFTTPVPDNTAPYVHEHPWLPRDHFFAPGKKDLDPRLFDGDRMRPEVRRHLLSLLNAFWAPKYGDSWQSWARVYLAGSEASHFYGNDDLDILIGVDYDTFRNAVPELAHLSGEEISTRLTDELRHGLNDDHRMLPGPDGEETGPFENTWYINPDSYDIRDIKPYAAYDITRDEWAVRPVELPDDFGPEKLPESTWDVFDALTTLIKAIAELPPGTREREGAALYDYLHGDRHAAFGPEGTGLYDPANATWKALDAAPGHPLQQLIEWKHAHDSSAAKEPAA